MDRPQFGHRRFALSSDYTYPFEWHVRCPQVQGNEEFPESKFDLLHSLQSHHQSRLPRFLQRQPCLPRGRKMIHIQYQHTLSNRHHLQVQGPQHHLSEQAGQPTSSLNQRQRSPLSLFARYSESGSGVPVAIAWRRSVLHIPELHPEANVKRMPYPPTFSALGFSFLNRSISSRSAWARISFSRRGLQFAQGHQYLIST